MEIGGRRSGDMLWNVRLRALVGRDQQAGLVYRARSESAAAGGGGTSSATGFAPGLLEAINRARQQGGRPRLELERGQSESNQHYASYLAYAMRANDRRAVEMTALGLLAGWDVRGAIRDGGIYWAISSQASSAERWLGAALESPFGRWILMDPSMSRLALGADRIGHSGTLAVVTTYSLFDSPQHEADEDTVFRELTELRKARGLGSPERIMRSPDLTEALAKVAQERDSVAGAVEQLVQRASRAAGHRMNAWVVETNSLYHFAPPEPLFKDSLKLEIGVTHYKAPGGAWGQYVIVFLLHDSERNRAVIPLQKTDRVAAARAMPSPN